jgi:hypothetical protein
MMMRGEGRPGRPARGEGRGPGGPRREEEPPSAEGIGGWFAGRLPDEWFEGDVEVEVDRDEVLVVGTLASPSTGDDPVAAKEAEAGRISRFREQTREERMAIAREAEHRYGRKVAWGAQAAGTRHVFTNLSIPVMTRLRQPSDRCLDTLVDSGVAAAGPRRWPGASSWSAATPTAGWPSCARPCRPCRRSATRDPRPRSTCRG